jgi:hypothetical protein
MAYYYFRGMVPGDRVLSSYIQAGGSKDVFGWVDVQCDYETISLHYICEFKGKDWFWGARGPPLLSDLQPQCQALALMYSSSRWPWVHMQRQSDGAVPASWWLRR